MKCIKLIAFLMMPLLAACVGSGSTSAALPKAVLAPLGSQIAAGALSEAERVASQNPLPLYTPSTSDLLYVGNVGNNSITVYRHDAQGNNAPLRVIVGSKTGIDNPGQQSEDAQGNLYVANTGNAAAADSSILVFAHGANGNVAPIRKLVGSLRLKMPNAPKRSKFCRAIFQA